MAVLPSTAPVLSTPDTHILDQTVPTIQSHCDELSDEQFRIRYEINQTINQIKTSKWRRVALQFPDEMLPDSVRVYQFLSRGLMFGSNSSQRNQLQSDGSHSINEDSSVTEATSSLRLEDETSPVKLTILADTSYGSCCVDEIAAEHIDADAVIHYGRACLSPTMRLPVVHVFTQHDLDHSLLVDSFKRTFPDFATKVILTADVTYAAHVGPIHASLTSEGYTDVFPASILHDPSSSIPNRTVPEAVRVEPSVLLEYQIFHISEPPTSLLLTLSSRAGGVYIYPTTSNSMNAAPSSCLSASSPILRRRYALVTSLTTVSIWGILINTLSVKNYLDIVEHVKKQILDAGKKSYLVVVGKLNAAKVANFSEIGGWVVIGCWESSLIDSKDFYRPVITPFELGLTLKSDKQRLWTGEWRADFQSVLDDAETTKNGEDWEAVDGLDNYSDEEESEPPEFDLRTGRYVSHTRPLSAKNLKQISAIAGTEPLALAKRSNRDLAVVNGVASPAAEYLRSKRTWQGLGSEREIQYEEDEMGTAVEEGRSGMARGYTVGESEART